MAMVTNHNSKKISPTKDKKLDSEVKEFNVKDIELIPESTKTVDGSGFNIVSKREDTRGRLAQLFILGFFFCLIGISIFSLLSTPAEGKTAIDNLREAILTVSGVLSGPLGFIIGFYFRKGDD